MRRNRTQEFKWPELTFTEALFLLHGPLMRFLAHGFSKIQRTMRSWPGGSAMFAGMMNRLWFWISLLDPGQPRMRVWTCSQRAGSPFDGLPFKYQKRPHQIRPPSKTDSRQSHPSPSSASNASSRATATIRSHFPTPASRFTSSASRTSRAASSRLIPS